MDLLSKSINRSSAAILVLPDLLVGHTGGYSIQFTIRAYKFFDPGGGERYWAESKDKGSIVDSNGEEKKITRCFFYFCDFGRSFCHTPLKLEDAVFNSSLGNEITNANRSVLLISYSGFDCEALTEFDLLLRFHWNQNMFFISWLDYVGYWINNVISLKLWILDFNRVSVIDDFLVHQGDVCYIMNLHVNMFWFDPGDYLMLSMHYNPLVHFDCHRMIIIITEYLSGNLIHEAPMDFIGVDLDTTSAVHWSKITGHMLCCWMSGFVVAIHDQSDYCSEIEDAQELSLVKMVHVRFIHDPGGAYYLWGYYDVPAVVLLLSLCFELLSLLLVLVVLLLDFSNFGVCFSSLLLGVLAFQVRSPIEESTLVLPYASLPTSAASLGYRDAFLVASLSCDAIFRAASTLIVGCLPVLPSWLLVYEWILIVLVGSDYVFYSGHVGD